MGAAEAWNETASVAAGTCSMSLCNEMANNKMINNVRRTNGDQSPSQWVVYDDRCSTPNFRGDGCSPDSNQHPHNKCRFCWLHHGDYPHNTQNIEDCPPCANTIQENMPYYPPVMGKCLDHGSDIPALAGCMTLDEAKKRCSTYLGSDVSTCAGFFTDGTRCGGDIASDAEAAVAGEDCSHSVCDEMANDRTINNVLRRHGHTGHAQWIVYDDACNTPNFHGDGCGPDNVHRPHNKCRFCWLHKEDYPDNTQKIEMCPSCAGGANPLPDNVGYNVHFNTAFKPVACPGKADSQLTHSVGQEAEAIQAQFRLEVKHKLLGSIRSSSPANWKQMADKCASDGSCQSYAWNCPGNQCQCYPGDICTRQWPEDGTSFQFSSSTGALREWGGQLHNVYVKQPPISGEMASFETPATNATIVV